MQNLDKYNVAYYSGKIQGIPYFLFHRPGQPISIRTSFVAGTRFDIKPGIAHFLEHMLLAGSKKYPDKRSLVVNLENLGGMVGATTDLDLLTIYVEIADKKDIPKVFEILEEVINQPLFDPKTIEAERGAILSEILMRYHNRSTRVKDIVNQLLYQGTDCGKIVIGTKDSVESISRDDLLNFYSTIFKHNPVSWSISGDIEEKDFIDILPKIQQSDIDLKNLFAAPLPVIRKDTILLEEFNDSRTDLCLGFRTESADKLDAASLDVLVNYLALGRGSKLQDELRYKRGLVYSCHGENFLGFNGGDWNIYTSCQADKTQEVIDIVIKEIKMIRESGIAEEELNIVKNRMNKGSLRDKQTATSWTSMATKPSFMMHPEKFLITNYEQDIEKVTSESVIKMAQKYLRADNWCLAMCGPEILKDIKVNF